MKSISITTAILFSVCLSATAGFCGAKGETIDGKKEFEKHCAMCHPNGGNIVNAQKPLNMQSLKANGVKGVKGIIAKMRKPGPGMTAFDDKTIPNKEAKAIAEYILKTFK
ncbi:cytochrome c6-like [Geobacter sp. OR-1]|uniref:c-type cytochrome n=1 Tax=Geobacter sp. OR-1 TaxID=1266765 RepID=UPI00054220E3|nr:c-type cytochrome [Geobacter sp. OR-1]GAM11094.1 cytochrome c6-like [Geobacter sp. OR-1]